MRHLYVHVPFCARRCTYCDFSIAVRRSVPAQEYVDAIRAELDVRFGGRRLALDTVYFGGGTPSRLGGEGVTRLLDVIADHATLAPAAEVTLEANPDDVTAESATAWRRAGVNRLSLGAQSFHDDVLAWMHRTHDARGIATAVEHARDAGIDNVSLDLIFALPAEVTRSWERDVDSALALQPEHVSLYGLTVEPHTPLGRRHFRGELAEAPEERYEHEFLYADATLTAAGFEHYEVSNFARPGRQSRHNASYWSDAAYAGIGPAAHEFDGNARRWNVAPYAEWLARVVADTDPMGGCERLTEENRVAEEIYVGLRTRRGVRIEGTESARAALWMTAGWAILSAENQLRLTPLGWLRLDAIAADLTHVRSRY
jgi:oxygen-independent coproporphyrinogen-3 oxidase